MAKVNKTQLVVMPYDTEEDRSRARYMESWLTETYGTGGTQADRSWFSRVHSVIKYTMVTKAPRKTGLPQVSHRPSWHYTYRVYFRNQVHATHFSLKWS